MALRQRKKTFVKSVEDLDAFPKVPESYVEKEASNAIGKKMVNFKLSKSSFLIIDFFFFFSLLGDAIFCNHTDIQRI